MEKFFGHYSIATNSNCRTRLCLVFILIMLKKLRNSVLNKISTQIITWYLIIKKYSIKKVKHKTDNTGNSYNISMTTFLNKISNTFQLLIAVITTEYKKCKSTVSRSYFLHQFLFLIAVVFNFD